MSPAPPRDLDVRGLFSRLATGLASQDMNIVDEAFNVPCVLMSDKFVTPILTDRTLYERFSGGMKSFAKRGVESIRADVESVTQLSPNIYQATVRWPGYDRDGQEIWSETTEYIVRTNEHGRPKIVLAVSLGVSHGHKFETPQSGPER